MAYSVSYGSRTEVMAVSIQTSTDAIAQAFEWIRAGRQNVVMTDLETGKKRDAVEIMRSQDHTGGPRQMSWGSKQLS